MNSNVHASAFREVNMESTMKVASLDLDIEELNDALQVSAGATFAGCSCSTSTSCGSTSTTTSTSG